MIVFKTLNKKEEKEFRAWARRNYKTFRPIYPWWHPVVRDECEKMRKESKHKKRSSRGKTGE